MKIKPGWNYLLYLLNHKWYVFLECWKAGLYIHAFTHDLSKFRPSEFFPYAYRFYGGKKLVPVKMVEWKLAWLLHQRRNRHHWDYWVQSDGVPLPMPFKYVKQMVCDWRAMGRVTGSIAWVFYKEKHSSMVLHEITKAHVTSILYPDG